MAASVVEICIQENQQQENLHLEAAPQSWSGKGYSQNLGKIQEKCLRRSPLFIILYVIILYYIILCNNISLYYYIIFIMFLYAYVPTFTCARAIGNLWELELIFWDLFPCFALHLASDIKIEKSLKKLINFPLK